MDPFEFESFTNRAYFTIKHKIQKRAGNFTDQVIEQSLMRLLKTLGGLTRGRGITDSVVTKWILSSLVMHDISDAIEDFVPLIFLRENNTWIKVRTESLEMQ